MSYSFYGEFYGSSLNRQATFAGDLMANSGLPCIGWLEWFQKMHPELYKKYKAAQQTINDLWDKQESVEEWKRAVRNEEEGCKWAVQQYLAEMEKTSPAAGEYAGPHDPVQRIVIEVTERKNIEEVLTG